MNRRTKRVVHSALWAAYGDALGFITELADGAKLRRRAAVERVDRLVDWSRHLPSRRPIEVRFPAGTYSDDTQLRLATSRAIRADGTFDVAAFAKVELPTWTNYALGAGVSSKEAAFSLAKASTQWYSNFFETRRASYKNGGGNGAAMRVQPHVWAHNDGAHPFDLLRDVYRNAVCTHGHARGILGAGFHALSLKSVLESGDPVSFREMRRIAFILSDSESIFETDSDLRTFWLPEWQNGLSDLERRENFQSVIAEILGDIDVLEHVSSRSGGYREGLEAIEATLPASRGSGTKTALAATWLSMLLARDGARAICAESANVLGSDTDTIGTMAGALAGALSSDPPDELIQDSAYIIQEAERLADVADGRASHSFGYPDLRGYKPPKSAVDAVFADGDGYVVSGIGRAVPMGGFVHRGDPAGDLRWLALDFGQTILARIRQEPMTASDARQQLFVPQRKAPLAVKPTRPEAKPEPSPVPAPRASTGQASPVRTLDDLADDIIAGGFQPDRIGKAILYLTSRQDERYLERVVSFSAIVSRAYKKSKSE
jgi:ADP-ribosylglycohydrolase